MALSFSARISRTLLRLLVKARSAPVEQLRTQEARSARAIHRARKGVTLAPWTFGRVSGWQAVPEERHSSEPWVHLHGGGYVIGGLASHQTLIQLMALALRRTVILPEYRLAPESPFPAALDDVRLVAQAFGEQPWILSGDSAGGGLALALVQSLRDEHLPLPRVLVLMSPWTDLSNSGASHRTLEHEEVLLTKATLDSWAGLYAGTFPRNHPRLSPLFGSFSGLPPTLVQVGSLEILLDDSRRLVAMATEQGCEAVLSVWEGLWHVWPVLGDVIPETRQALDEIVRFVSLKSPSEVR